jgi:hypothetical protein
MKTISLTIIFFAMYLSGFSQIRDYREVILFYPNQKIDTASKQLKIFSEDLAGLLERQIRTVRVVTNSKDFENYKSFNIKPSLFTLVLVGKDGDRKFSSNKTITSKKLFSIIDIMPMRKKEMKD